MQDKLRHSYLPSPERLSILTATILLAYALTRFVDIPGWQLGVQLPGIYLGTTVNLGTLVSVLVAVLTAAGADWLMRDHPERHHGSMFEHWILPALTALIIAIPLTQMPLSLVWWVGFALGGAALILVLVAEYIVLDPEDMRHPLASMGLIAISFALFLALAVALRFAEARLFLILPALSLAAGLVSVRAMHLRLHGRWAYLQSGVVAFVVAQLVAALHYLPLSPVPYGLILLGSAYALTSFLARLEEGEAPRQAIYEPIAILTLVWGAAIWIR
jgi:hypothetical protein